MLDQQLVSVQATVIEKSTTYPEPAYTHVDGKQIERLVCTFLCSMSLSFYFFHLKQLWRFRAQSRDHNFADKSNWH